MPTVTVSEFVFKRLSTHVQEGYTFVSGGTYNDDGTVTFPVDSDVYAKLIQKQKASPYKTFDDIVSDLMTGWDRGHKDEGHS